MQLNGKSAHLAHVRPWAPSPAQQEEKKRALFPKEVCVGEDYKTLFMQYFPPQINVPVLTHLNLGFN